MSERIGGIPTSLFESQGNTTIHAPHGDFYCEIGPSFVYVQSTEFCRINVYGQVDAYGAVQFGVYNRGYNDNPFLPHPDLYAANLIVNGIMPYFYTQGYSPTHILAEWENKPGRVNYIAYTEGIRFGLNPQEAAAQSWTYRKLAVPLGFTAVAHVEETLYGTILARFARI